ncbi:hypothetical protein [uncultured Limosilactobacillus sp.]|uniref:hypothetical protein n=1 Tax=uncultured Limosilactobacillus sp. TaxID=2837629 RepID=UPI0025FD92E6|nr:hypothetical protein [uncultured Limosilactobacillus sp.]
MMLSNRELNDQERLMVAKLEYQILQDGELVRIVNRPFWVVQQHILMADGFQMLIIQNRRQREYTLLFKGSSGIIKGTPETWNHEWLGTNLPIGRSLFIQRDLIPSQLQTAAKVLNQVLKRWPQAKFYLYGHSLGSINIQYALASCSKIGRVKRADIYEGPNIYWLLSRRQQQHVRKFKHKVNNYIDVYDPVAAGYVDGRYLVGRLRYVKSKLLPPISQHMWGGYQFSSNGRLRLQPLDDRFRFRAVVNRRLMVKRAPFTTPGEDWWPLIGKQSRWLTGSRTPFAHENDFTVRKIIEQWRLK